jgi:hypothetical protein
VLASILRALGFAAGLAVWRGDVLDGEVLDDEVVDDEVVDDEVLAAHVLAAPRLAAVGDAGVFERLLLAIVLSLGFL